MYKVIVIGELCEDVLMHNPASVKVQGLEVWAEDIKFLAGGSATYASQTFRHLGDTVSVVSVLGDDVSGLMILDTLNQLGIDCKNIDVIHDKKTTISMLVCNGPEKTFIGCSPMLPMPVKEASDDCVPDLIYIAGYMLYPELWTDEAYEFLLKLKRKGARIALDGQLLPINDFDPVRTSRLDRILPLVDVFFAARKEAISITGSSEPRIAGDFLLNLGCKLVVLKQGKHGCIAMYAGETFNSDGLLTDTYDTVGSGDIYGAAFCHGLLKGWDIQYNLEFASIFTALSLKRYETMKILPQISEVESIIAKKNV